MSSTASVLLAADPANAIAFQGLPGAYSNLACREMFPAMEALPCASFEDAFAAVNEGRAALAMIPIENSLAGRVADIHHLLPDSGLFIIAEHFLRVRHHLLAPKGASLASLKRVHSHVQALSQCRKALRDLGLEPINATDTAGAAADIAKNQSLEDGAIASALAAEIYGLEILRSHIEDRLGNTTRFVVMSRARRDPDPHSGPTMTSLVFQVRSQPAALYKCLGGFATNSVNVTKLESYITDESFQVAQFYAEIEGHPANPEVSRALDELKYYASKFKILGVYPASKFRSGQG